MKLWTTVFCLVLSGCTDEHVYPKAVEIANSKCAKNDGWTDFRVSCGVGVCVMDIRCRDEAKFHVTMPIKEMQP